MNAVAVATGRGAGAERFPFCSRGVWSVKGDGKSAAWQCRPKGEGRVAVVARVYRSKRPSQPQPLNRSSSFSGLDPVLDINSLRWSSSVRLIDEEQKMVGIVNTNKAIQMADEAELDLVILSGDADPPVVRVMDYRKYKYEQQKKKREQQKKSGGTRSDIKELKMGSLSLDAIAALVVSVAETCNAIAVYFLLLKRPFCLTRCNIDVHDYDVRLRAAKRFLKDGDKVKIIVQFKGREHNFRENTISLFERFKNDLGKMAITESKNFADKIMSMVLTPNKRVLNKSEENPTTKQVSAGV